MLIQNNYQSRMGVPLFYYSSSTSPLLQTTTLPIHNNNSNSKSIAANSFNYYPVTPPYSHQYDYHLKSYPSSDFNQHQYSGQRYLETSPSPLGNTPPITPPSEPSIAAAAYSSTPANTQHLRNRNSVIMKVKDHQITSVMSALSLSKTLSNDSHSNSSDLEEILCKWENCFQHFNTLEDLSAHVSQVHAMAGLKGLYYCKWEGCARTERGFNARYKMLVHSRTHTKDKPHQCSECSKCFSRAENLKIHKRSHSGEKPYLCPVEGCNKAYSNSSDRFKHTRTHTNDKPYVCKIPGCQKRYTDPSSLRKHLKTFKHPVAETLEDVVDVDAKFASHLIISSQESPTKDLRSLEDRVMSVAEQELMDNDSMVFSGGVLYKAENSGNESVEELCRVNSYEQYTHSSHYYENNFYLWNGKSSDCFPTDNMPLDLSIHRR